MEIRYHRKRNSVNNMMSAESVQKEHWMNWHMKVILSGKEVVEAL